MPIATTIATRMTSTFSRQTASLCGGVCGVEEGVESLRFLVGGATVARLHGRPHLFDLRLELGDRCRAQAVAPITNQLLRVADEEMAVLDVARLKHAAKR